MRRCRLLSVVCCALFAAGSLRGADFPPVDDLPSHPELPNPLVFFDGTPVATPKDWTERRRPELKALFQQYMYGYLPAAPEKVPAKVTHTDPNALHGKATLELVELSVGPGGKRTIHVLLLTPNKRAGAFPVFVGINFCGNHTVLPDPAIPLPTTWLYPSCPGCVETKATDAGRGGQFDTWAVDQTIERGYAIALFYNGDLDPDTADFADGIHPLFYKEGQTQPGPTEWGTIASWAWGVHRVVDFLTTRSDVDQGRICVVGHSRLGKTALLAGALDERIDLVIPHQAGCGGTAPSRGKVGESVERINTSFPHWFNDQFPKFNKQVDKLPFDQHGLVALCAPRPVLLSNAVEDTWANPDGQFEVLVAADPVYKFLDAPGLAEKKAPPLGELMNSRLGYYVRPGKHSMTREDWKVFLDFADRQLGAAK